ncbi:hypothetical protein F511_07300 [Dorcoceras hygrometricum]|uniref:Uncharacterized protein n=1 Tax=Dorcoceras hygrometricum TaxID=472368 RepID=A0A2Z7CWN5_9LAMI|nr:hypothetical protein F511_07300 [Dorcoceras hygrometricum]
MHHLRPGDETILHTSCHLSVQTLDYAQLSVFCVLERFEHREVDQEESTRRFDLYRPDPIALKLRELLAQMHTSSQAV